MKKGKKQLLRLIVNIGTSGKYNGEGEFGISDYLIRYVLLNFIIIFGSIILALFTVQNFGYGQYFTAICCGAMIFIGLLSFLLARTRLPQFVPALVLMVFYSLMCLAITWTGESGGANFLFIYVYPLLTIMLLGMHVGAILSTLLVALMSVEMFVSDLSKFNYHFDFSLRMLVNYFLIFSVMIVIEITRRTKDRLIEIQNRKLNELNKQLVSANEKLTALSTTDELTKLNNRRAFVNYIEIIWKQSHRLKLPITVVMLDIDYFKRYNDSLGHLQGDNALVAISQCMKDQLKRETDFIARYGGEEFVCLLPYIDRAEATSFTQKLIQSVENLHLPHPMCDHSKYVTISAGMASIVPHDNNNWEQLLDEADKALYQAKDAGRNRLIIANAKANPLFDIFRPKQSKLINS